MKCERCGKDDAVVRITRLDRSGRPTQINLCQSCAAEHSPHQKKIFEKQATFDLLLKAMLAQQKIQVTEEESAQRVSANPCPSCGLDFSVYKATCMLGCPDCYDAFAEALESDLERLHRATSHVVSGDMEKSELAIAQERLQAMREELKSSIEYEDYERAAFLRDEINRLEKEISGAKFAEVKQGKEKGQ